MRIQYSFYCPIVAALIFIGCQSKSNGTSTGNPLVSLTMTSSSQTATVARLERLYQKIVDLFAPSASASTPPTMTDAGGRSVTMGQFWIMVDNIEFEPTQNPTSGEVDGTEIAFAGPYGVNLLSAVPQSLGQNMISLTGIMRIKFALSPATTLPNGAPSGLSGNSIYLQATVGGASFSFSTTDGTEIEVGGPNMVTASQQSVLVWQIQTANLIKKIDLSAVTAGTNISASNVVPATNPCPLINSSAANLYTCFRDGFSTEANFGVDLSGQGELTTGDPTVR